MAINPRVNSEALTVKKHIIPRKMQISGRLMKNSSPINKPLINRYNTRKLLRIDILNLFTKNRA